MFVCINRKNTIKKTGFWEIGDCDDFAEYFLFVRVWLRHMGSLPSTTKDTFNPKTVKIKIK